MCLCVYVYMFVCVYVCLCVYVLLQRDLSTLCECALIVQTCTTSDQPSH